jgi:hypothetical protein
MRRVEGEERRGRKSRQDKLYSSVELWSAESEDEKEANKSNHVCMVSSSMGWFGDRKSRE